MTDEQEKAASTTDNMPSSLSLPFDPKDLLAVRIKPAEFARILSVSKQTVSRWIKAEKITVSPIDGRLDLQKALSQLMRTSDPSRLRVPLLRAAMSDMGNMREAVAKSEALAVDLGQAKAHIAYLDSFIENQGCMFDGVLTLLVEHEQAFRDSPDSTAWRALIDQIEYEAACRCEPAKDEIEAQDFDDELSDFLPENS